MRERRTAKRKAPGTTPRGAIEKPALAARKPIALDDGWHAELRRLDGGAVLRVSRPSGGAPLELEIHLTDAGPVVRARASAIEIESDGDLVARCDRFRVEARKAIDLISSGALRAEGREIALRATHGSAVVDASDDVQLLGEQVLLNCDRPAPLPAWVTVAPAPEHTVARQDEGGDAELFVSIGPK